MASTPLQNARANHARRLQHIMERLAGASKLLMSPDLQAKHPLQAGEALEHAEKAFAWTEEMNWLHEQDKAERIAAARLGKVAE